MTIIHSCPKWDKFQSTMNAVEISDVGNISEVYVDYDNDWNYKYDPELKFEFCPYCKGKLN